MVPGLHGSQLDFSVTLVKKPTGQSLHVAALSLNVELSVYLPAAQARLNCHGHHGSLALSHRRSAHATAAHHSTAPEFCAYWPFGHSLQSF
jgi:hypothetical protein